jgi:hypothetical protein
VGDDLASDNSQDQFAASPDFDTILIDAAIELQESQNTLADQVIGDKSVRDKLKAILLGPMGLYQKLKELACRRRGVDGCIPCVDNKYSPTRTHRRPCYAAPLFHERARSR